MTDAHRITATDPAARQHRRAKRGLVASWIHEISARHGAASGADERVESVRAADPALGPEPDQALA